MAQAESDSASIYFRKTNDVVVDFKLRSELVQYVILNFLPDLRVIWQDLHRLRRCAAPLTSLELYKCIRLGKGPRRFVLKIKQAQTSHCCTERVLGAKAGQSRAVIKQELRKQAACFVDQGGEIHCSLLLQQQHRFRKPTTASELEQPGFTWKCFSCGKSGNFADFF